MQKSGLPLQVLGEDGKRRNMTGPNLESRMEQFEVDTQVAREIETLKYGEITETRDGKALVKISKLKFYEFTSNILQNLEHNLFVKGSWLLIRDVVGEDTVVFGTIESLSGFLRDLKPHISSEVYGALSFAFHIRKIEDQKVDAKLEIEKLFKAYGGRGVRLYSLLASGILEREIFHLLQKEPRMEEISGHIEKLIRSPGVVFISEGSDKDSIKYGIKDQLQIKKDSEVFARGERLIEETKKAIKEIEKEEDIIYKLERGCLGVSPHMTFHISRPETILPPKTATVEISCERVSDALNHKMLHNIIGDKKLESELLRMVDQKAEDMGVKLTKGVRETIANLSLLAAKETSEIWGKENE